MLDFSSEVFYRGECFYAYKYFGAHITDGGVIFRVYAPAARRVELSENLMAGMAKTVL